MPLLGQVQAEEALRAPETVLAKEPNPHRAFAGAMQAAEQARDATKAAGRAPGYRSFPE